MSTINITHEMVEIKEQLARSAAIRADTRQREKEAEEETACSHLRLNNLEITLRNVQRDTEQKLKRACPHS
jgi:cell division protein ZapA (FtsZ GTPase activity inhibitor)